MMGRRAEASVCVRPVCQVCKMTNMPTCATCVHMHIECERGRVGHGMKVCSAPDCVLVYKSLCVNMQRCASAQVSRRSSAPRGGLVQVSKCLYSVQVCY